MSAQHTSVCCWWMQDEPGDPDWCDCGLVVNDNIPFWAEEATVKTTFTYHSDKAMRKGNIKMAKKGWTVESVKPVEQGYGCLKTGCLGVLFFPLALLGKKPTGYLVLYVK